MSAACEPAPRFRGYRVPSARLPGFDYGRGVFFVTVVTRGRRPWFGRVRGGRMVPSAFGRIVEEEWARTAAVRASVTVDAFVVMPDHVHGVLAIDPDGAPPTTDDVPRVTGGVPDVTGGVPRVTGGVETPRGASLPGMAVPTTGSGVRGGVRDEWRPDTLGAVVNHFKGACTRRIRASAPAFAWQPRFWDVVVRDRRHLGHVRRYVAENPARWRGR